MITTNGALDGNKILSFFTTYPSVLRSVDDFVSIVPNDDKGVGRSIQQKSGSMCADEVDTSRPRAIINSGDVVFAYFTPGGKCANQIELIKINNLEKSDDRALPDGHDFMKGNPASKQSYDFHLIDFLQQKPISISRNADAGCDSCHLRSDNKMVPIWDIMPKGVAKIDAWPGAVALTGLIQTSLSLNPILLKAVQSNRRFRFLFSTEEEKLKWQLGPSLTALDKLFQPTGAIDPRIHHGGKGNKLGL